MKEISLNAPFLKQIKICSAPTGSQDSYPFNIPIFASTPEIMLDCRVTFLVGENGSGKSTLLEAIALQCGFNIQGGNRNHLYADGEQEEGKNQLADMVRLSWLPRVTSGFFLRAESFFNFASYLDELARQFPSSYNSYGGQSLHTQSHGESFLALFKHRFGEPGIYLLDEPEAALSPKRQLAFLSLIHDLEQTGKAQFIIATHSPILLSYPNAMVLSFDSRQIVKINFKETDHYQITKEFLENPERYYRHLFGRGN